MVLQQVINNKNTLWYCKQNNTIKYTNILSRKFVNSCETKTIAVQNYFVNSCEIKIIAVKNYFVNSCETDKMYGANKTNNTRNKILP